MKKTSIITNKKSKLVYIANIISLIIFIYGILLMSFIIFSFTYPKPIIIDGQIINEIDGILMYNLDIEYKISVLLIIGIIFIFFPLATFFGKLIGTFKAKHLIKKDDKFIKKINPYIYYRELPNEYGIGICTLLIDSSIENEKDIIATILNLCTKKYLKLEKNNTNYIIHILKDIDDKPYLTEEDINNKLFLNEKYLLNCLKNNTIKNIDYNKWYSLCLQDGKNNGLYYDKILKNNRIDINKDIKKDKATMKIIWLTMIILLAIIIISNIDINIFKNIEYIFSIIVIIPLLFFITYILSSLLFAIIMIIKGLFRTYNRSEKYYYNNKLSKKLVLTEKGKIELQKLYAFENFINDFGAFANKNPEEIIIWDKYLSYAVMFNMTKTMLKSGYKQLINNSSFIIDDIDNIHINNLTIK